MRSPKALKAEITPEGMVLFTFESVVKDLGDPGLESSPLNFEEWDIKDQHVPECVKRDMAGESVTGYLYYRETLQSMLDGKNGGIGDEGEDSGTAEQTGPGAGDHSGGSGVSVQGGSEDSVTVGEGGQAEVHLDSGGPSPVPGC